MDSLQINNISCNLNCQRVSSLPLTSASASSLSFLATCLKINLPLDHHMVEFKEIHLDKIPNCFSDKCHWLLFTVWPKILTQAGKSNHIHNRKPNHDITLALSQNPLFSTIIKNPLIKISHYYKLTRNYFKFGNKPVSWYIPSSSCMDIQFDWLGINTIYLHFATALVWNVVSLISITHDLWRIFDSYDRWGLLEDWKSIGLPYAAIWIC